MGPRGATIDETQIGAFLEAEADFAFEMRTLHALTQLAFACEHGGTFRDPITDKIRQFDIRAHVARGICQLWLSVECKNIGPDSPLLIHAVPRTKPEAFHEIVWPPNSSTKRSWAESKRIERFESAYRPEEPVGKHTDQVTLRGDGTFARSDSAVFDKISQSINGARDLMQQGAAPTSQDTLVAIVPVLVVPDERLWQVAYAPDGSIVQEPKRVDRSSLYINHAWEVAIASLPLRYTLSHLEITTLHGLHQLVSYLFSNRGVFALEDAVFSR